MSTFSRRRIAFAGVAGISLATAGVMAPGALAADTIDGDVSVTNTETVQVLMSADGKVDAQRVYEQISLIGSGKVDLSNPVSTKGLRNLDGFGGYDVRDGKARIKTDVDGTKKLRSVSEFTKDLPLKFEVTYLLDGEEVDAADVVGKSGKLEVKYRVTNVTGTDQEVTYVDGSGKEQTSTEKVVVPMVGSMTTTLPSTFTNIETVGSNSAGDGRGGTQLSFTMTLFPPIGNAVAEVGYTADVEDAVIPKASLSALPVNAIENNSFKGGAASYKGGAESGQELTAGAVTIDENLLKIRDGANELVKGLLQLSAGADKLSAGLQKDAAPGAGKLAAGAKELDAGAGKLGAGTDELSAGAGKLRAGAGALAAGAGALNDGAKKVNDGAAEVDAGAGSLADGAGDLTTGAGQLAEGLNQAEASAPALLDGLDEVAGGLDQVSAGLSQLNTQVVGGANSINTGAIALVSGLNNQLIPGLGQAEGALDQALQLANSLDGSVPQKANLVTAITGAKTAVTQVKGGLSSQVVPGLTGIRDGSASISAGVSGNLGADGAITKGVNKLQDGVGALQAGGEELLAGIEELSDGADRLAAGTGQLQGGAEKLAAGTGALRDGTSDLAAGSGKVSNGAGDLADGTSDLKAGVNKLDAGVGDLMAGTDQLAAGAGTLAGGLGTAAAGSGELAAGLRTASESAPDLPEGATKLSNEGTKKLVSTGDATAMDYGLKYALIEASSERGASAQPYGSPEGATELTAYKFEIAGADGAGSENMKRGLAALALLAGAGAFAAVRRRGLS
jgi:putative membrane protein